MLEKGEEAMPDTRILVRPPTEILRQDHHAVKKLFTQYEQLEEDELERRQELFEELNAAITLHAQIEDMLFYPAVLDVSTGKAHRLVQEAHEEHLVIQFLLEDLSDLTPAEGGFDEKMRLLKETVERHIEEEEAGLFQECRKLPRERLLALSVEMEVLRNDLEYG
jgi:hemerythrin superfamily protein